MRLFALILAALALPAPISSGVVDGRGQRAELSRLPRHFEPNRGQVPDTELLYLSHGDGHLLGITSTGIVVTGANGRTARLSLAGAAPAASVTGLDRQSAVTNYLVGRDPASWRTRIPHYARVKLASVYPGVGVVFYPQGRDIEYDFEIAPHASPWQIRMQWDHAGVPVIDRDGGITTETPAGPVRLAPPRAWQDTVAGRSTVDVRFALSRGSRAIRFVVGTYDPQLPLTIDPTLTYSGFIGGSQFDAARAVAVDAAGNAYFCGLTRSTNLSPFASPGNPAQATFGGGNGDAFIAKMNSAGNAMVYLTYLGGSDWDQANAIAVDNDGNAYVAGFTSSPNFPLAAPLNTLRRGNSDGFLVKLNPAGSALLFSSLIGGSADDQGVAIGLDPQRAVYVTGYTDSADFPTTAGAFRTGPAGESDIWVVKFLPALTAVVYATLLGGSSWDTPSQLTVDGAGNAFVTGSTYSPNFPVTPGAFVTTNPQGVQKGYVTKINPAGSGLAFSSYFCGTSDNFSGLAIDEFGHPYLTGWTPMGDIPITTGAYQQTARGVDAFVAKLNSTATALLYSTYLGGSGTEFGAAVGVNAAGHAFATGVTTSTNFPTEGGPYQAANPTTQTFGTSGYLTVMNPTGTGIVYSTYLGGSNADVLSALVLDRLEDVYIAGYSSSANYPRTPPIPPLAGDSDAIGTKLSGFDLPACRASNLNVASVTIPQGGASGVISVDAPAGCNWHALAGMPFVTLTGGTTGGLLGSAQGVVNYSVAANTGMNPRAAAVTIGRKIVQFIQPGTNATAPFDDVPLAHPFSNHVQLMKANAITSGCNATSYCPDTPTTRGQMAVFIIRSVLGGDTFPFPSTPYFSDVSGSHPFFRWIQKMRELGITTGCSATTYCPDEPVTRGQMAVFVIRSIMGNTFPHSTTPYFADVPAGHPFFAFIQKMREWGVTTGCSATDYCPDSPNTRGQMAVFIVRGFFAPR